MRTFPQYSILVVDDNAALLQMLQQYLTGLGCEVTTCSSPSEARELYRRDTTRYGLVLVDLNLPEMSGSELVLELLRLNPNQPVLLLSGYPFDLSVIPAELGAKVRFLQKPFSPKALAEAVMAMMQEP